MNEQHEQRLTTWERISLLLLFSALVIVTGITVFNLGTDDAFIVGPPEDRPIVSFDVSRPVPLLDALDVAQSWAREWSPDARLILVSAQFEFADEANASSASATAGSFLFTFSGPRKDDEWPRLVLAVSRQTGNIYFEDELWSSVQPPWSIDELIVGLPVTAEQAFQTAFQVTGRSYRSGCEASRSQVQVVLDATQPQDATWVVVFFDQRERSTNDIVMRIDAETAATTTEERDDPTCSPT